MNSKLKKAIRDYYLHRSLDAITDPQSINVLIENNMIFPSEEIEHDELISLLLKERNAADKKSIVDSFLVGLESGHAEKRAALSAYAITFKFPEHSFKSEENIQCSVCGAFRKKTRVFTRCNLGRYSYGASYNGAPDDLYFFLREHNKSSAETVQSVSMLEEVLKILRNATPQDKPVTMAKKIRSIPNIQMDSEQSRGLLDLLGQISVLETSEHKGFLSNYTYIGLAPKKSRSTDWSYPIDFWTGKDGVNEHAVDFWFGEYL